MIDTHTHLYDPAFDPDREEAVARAKARGVERLLLPNINADTIEPMLDLCQRHPETCYPMLGLHPEDVGEDYVEVLDKMEERLQEPHHPFIAIGEVGLDFYWDKTYREQQLDAFERQICWARDHHLPLMIHTRSAHPELLEAMERHREDRLTGVFHCFSGSPEMARQLLSFPGFCLGIGGVTTYKKCKLPDTLAQAVPLERIVLETDSPYLAPVPHRGGRNESAYVLDTAAFLAPIYKVETADIERATTATALRLFPRLGAGKRTQNGEICP